METIISFIAYLETASIWSPGLWISVIAIAVAISAVIKAAEFFGGK